jgi:predicted helicase
MFPPGAENVAICFSDPGARAPYCVLAVDGVADLHFGSSVDGYQQAPLYRYENGERVDNITNWALDQFKKRYREETGRKRPITREAIFQYIYAVLHDPAYREQYLTNLKRDFPRVPFYPSFWTWAAWGKRLLELHLNHAAVEPYPLERNDSQDDSEPELILSAIPDRGQIRVDSQTVLLGVPREAWEYRLGSRTALEWVLYQNKPRKVKDAAVRELLKDAKAVDRKEEIIDLLRRVTTVSVETVKVVSAMQAVQR